MGELRLEINRYVCAEWIPEFGVYEARFNDARCTTRFSSANVGQVAAPVRRSVGECEILNVLAADAYETAYAVLEGTTDEDEADEAVRKAYWSNPHLGAAALFRTSQNLATEGIGCSDCPVLAFPETVVVGWGEFRSYVAAYLWPVDGGDGTVSIVACSGENGVGHLGLTNPHLIQAGFLAAAALAKDDSTHGEISSIGTGVSNVGLARTAIVEFLDSVTARSIVCGRLTEVEWYVQIDVRGCTESEGAE